MVHLETKVRSVIVAGDVTLDWNLARLKQGKSLAALGGWADTVRLSWQMGGAGQLAQIIEAAGADLAEKITLRRPPQPQEPLCPGDPRYQHTYSYWAQHPRSTRPPLDKEKPVWRVEKFMGIEPGQPVAAIRPGGEPVSDGEPELIVLDDEGLGFRDTPAMWPPELTSGEGQPWVILKMNAPVASGALWDELRQHHAGRLIVVMTVDDLRSTEVQISRELSWERTAQDVVWELVHNYQINAISRCAHVVVSFDSAGAILLSRSCPPDAASGAAQAVKSDLFFDPKVIEGMWEKDYPGAMTGYTSCLVASLARQCLLNTEAPDLRSGILAGLSAIRKLHIEGFSAEDCPNGGKKLAFPVRSVAAELAGTTSAFSVVEIQDPIRFLVEPTPAEHPSEDGYWTILRDNYRGNLNEIAQKIVLYGPEAALSNVPFGQFGGLLTVDRREIESFRSIRLLIGEYCAQGPQKRPLSIAVFGAPGSGKSFGIIQVASTLMPGQIEVLEFNLSQFNSPEDLYDAFHQVRDVGLGGKIPLVFWDEFDTPVDGKRLAWLRYFLAPMQDGKFLKGQVTHPIGRSIFVFAGGTCHNIEAFSCALPNDEFRVAKGPDFISRLKGYVNILGPNRQPARAGTYEADPYYIIRRAILLRSLLKRNYPYIFEKREGKDQASIDAGVLRAMLETHEFKHGVRSMESVMAMSQLAGKTSFERSSLPSEAQLDLHVDGLDFLAQVQRIQLDGDLLEKLARASHEVFCEGIVRRGYCYGPVTDEETRTHSSLMDYSLLPENEKQQNRDNVLNILDKLERTGYVMVPARSNEPPFDFPGDDLEMLAEMEHKRWMAAKQANGWQFAAETDKSQKLHKCLLPWDGLPDEEQDKDRDLVRGIPRILARVGYAILKSHQAQREG